MTTPIPEASTSSQNFNGRPPRSHSARNPRNRRHGRMSHSQEPSQHEVLRFSTDLEEVELPRILKRAPFVCISRAALEAVDPELKEIPLEFIIDGLKLLGPQIYTIASTSKVDTPGERLPRKLGVMINDISSEAPTHLLAVRAKSATRVYVFPVHAIILAIHCARLPAFPPSSSRTPAEAGSKITLPITKLFIPNPETFSILLHYLYTKHEDRLFSALLPIPLEDGKSIDELSRTYSSTFTVQALLSHANRVRGLWNNVVALGIFDERLSVALERTWDVLSKALAVSTGASWEAVSTVPQL